MNSEKENVEKTLERDEKETQASSNQAIVPPGPINSIRTNNSVNGPSAAVAPLVEGYRQPQCYICRYLKRLHSNKDTNDVPSKVAKVDTITRTEELAYKAHIKYLDGRRNQLEYELIYLKTETDEEMEKANARMYALELFIQKICKSCSVCGHPLNFTTRKPTALTNDNKIVCENCVDPKSVESNKEGQGIISDDHASGHALLKTEEDKEHDKHF